MSRTARAVAYYRMSTGKQEASVPAQREAVLKLAERDGYQIIREYVDEGVSGDDTERRTAFLRMRDDARSGDFGVILCWDQDRFGRFDTLDAGYWIKPIRDAGVRLVTVAQGDIGWEDFGGRLIYTVQQEGKHQFLRDMSRNTLRGMLAKARRGEWLGGRPPYGYRLDEAKRLVIGPAEEVRVVRWLFSEYAFNGATLGDLMDRLNREGTPSPGGKLWGKTAIHKILQRPIYTGVVAWNRTHEGKYHEVRGGEIAAASRSQKVRRNNGEGEWVQFDAPQLSLVGRDVFDLVQRKLVENRDCCTPNRGKRVFLLTGLLFCGGCGWPMHGAYQHKGGFNRYICGNYNIHRTRGGCRCNTLVESRFLDVLAEKIAGHFRRPEVTEALRAEIRRQELAEREGRENPAASVNARIAELDRKISEGAEKWLTAPPALTEILGRKLEEWRKERDRLHARRRELDRPAQTLEELDEAVEKILAGMNRLRELIDANPAGAKAMLREVVERVECRFTHVPYGETRQKSVLDGGVIDIREDLLLCRPVPLARPLMTVTPARTSPAARRAATRRP
jgi:DNA invertase Pin-like site-specific DNA recombinase